MFFPLRDDIPHFRPPVVTVSLIVLNAAVFLFELLLPPQVLQEFFFTFGFVPAKVLYQLHIFGWRAFIPVLTSTFLHGSFMHIFGNMWFLWLFGDNVEDRFGHLRFLIFYMLCGITAGLSQLVHAPHSMVPVVGASGAIAGVMGAYFMMFPYARIRVMFLFIIIPIFFYIPAYFFLPIWFLTQVTNAFSPIGQVSDVAWWAHIGGFIFGMALTPLFDRGLNYRRLA